MITAPDPSTPATANAGHRRGAASPARRWPSPARFVVAVAAAVGLAALPALPGLPAPVALAAVGDTSRVSVGPGGVEAGGGGSFGPSTSADGRFVAFDSNATNLVADDTNGARDVFVHDRITAITSRVNVGPAVAEAAGGQSFSASISADGRYVAFVSEAGNLLGAGVDTNGLADVFVHDRGTGATSRVSLGPAGAQATDGSSSGPSISADGRSVAFTSRASDLLVAGADTNALADVFVHDRSTGITSRVNVGPAGAQATGGESGSASISADGRSVAFSSEAPNLLGAGADTNALADVFVHDRSSGATSRVNVGPAGAETTVRASGNASISADGRFVAFSSEAPNLLGAGVDTNGAGDVFVRDRSTAVTSRVSLGPAGAQATGGQSSTPSISADGRYVTFLSRATSLVPTDTNDAVDVFVHDRTAALTTRVNLGPAGSQANGETSSRPSISADGRRVAYSSDATNLVVGDTNALSDVFLYQFLSDPLPPAQPAPQPPAAAACAGRAATILGTPGKDRIVGTPGRDVIAGLGGRDRIDGRDGKDLVCGGDGRDRLRGGDGHDRLRGGDGHDHLTGASGNDRLHGGPGRDRGKGGAGRDTLRSIERSP